MAKGRFDRLTEEIRSKEVKDCLAVREGRKARHWKDFLALSLLT